jgi:hypothetical protein
MYLKKLHLSTYYNFYDKQFSKNRKFNAFIHGTFLKIEFVSLLKKTLPKDIQKAESN